jgi:carboxymethylenebutenolidase
VQPAADNVFQETVMYQENEGPIEELIHLYVDGAFRRRELMRRLARYTGGVAAAMAALGELDLSHAQSGSSCPADASVPEDAPDLIVFDVDYAGEAGTLFGHMAYPRTATAQTWPGVLVIHENRGLVEHIRDVTRRVARAGYVALGVDLLSRQGGTQQFPDPQQQTAAYGRTTADQRLSDLQSSFEYLRSSTLVTARRVGVVGFCAGGGNVWNLVLNQPQLAAAVAFYGTPVPPIDQISRLQTPLLAMYAELDRNLTLQAIPVISAILTQQKTVGFDIYQGVGHAFHNDTGPAYNSTAACDAWNRTLAWFNKFLPPPS